MSWGIKHTVILVGVGVSVSAWAALLYILYKTREEERLESPESTVVTSRQTIIRIKVPKDVVGAIIGRNGCHIKEIQRKTNTRINFEDSVTDYDDSRTVIIRGAPNDAQHAEDIINQVIADQPEILTEEIFVPSRSCGRIIGKNGESIKNISRISKSKITVDSSKDERKAESLTRIVLKGTREQIDIAIGMVDEKLAEDESIRHQVELMSSSRPVRSKERRLCIENIPNDVKSADDMDKFEECLMPTGSDGFLEVYISAVETPSQFWVQLVGTKSIQLDKMVENMTSFYNQEKNQAITKVSEISIGDLVAASFIHDNLWYRAKVVKIEDDDYSPDESKITVFYVDFGDDAVLTRKQLFTLQSEFLVIPFQAIECSLAEVHPFGDEWSEESNIYFEKLTYAAQWKIIMAKPLKFSKDKDKKTIAYVKLVDTNNAGDINVSDELIKKGYAIRLCED